MSKEKQEKQNCCLLAWTACFNLFKRKEKKTERQHPLQQKLLDNYESREGEEGDLLPSLLIGDPLAPPSLKPNNF